MKIIKNIWREILLLLSLSGFAAMLFYWSVDRPDGTVAQSVMLIGIILDGILCVWLIRSLWISKWRKSATAAMQKMFARIQRFFERFAERLGIKRNEKKRVLSGKTTVFFDKFNDDGRKSGQTSAKPPKWKQLDSEREKMRYLYRQMISEKLKRGALIYASDTPSEVEKKAEQSRGIETSESELFEMYIGMRYDERKHPDGETVKRLKKELDIK